MAIVDGSDIVNGLMRDIRNGMTMDTIVSCPRCGRPKYYGMLAIVDLKIMCRRCLSEHEKYTYFVAYGDTDVENLVPKPPTMEQYKAERRTSWNTKV